MIAALSVALRERVVAAVAEGASLHAAAAQFGVSVASASRWCRQARETSSLTPKPRGGDRRSHTIKAHAEAILAVYEERPTLLLTELRAVLAERGIPISESSLSRFFRDRAIRRADHGSRGRAAAGHENRA